MADYKQARVGAQWKIFNWYRDLILRYESVLENAYTAYALNAVFNPEFCKYYSLYILAQLKRSKILEITQIYNKGYSMSLL